MAEDEHDPVVEQLRAWADDLVSRTESSVQATAVVRRRRVSISLAAVLVGAAAIAAIVVVQQRSGSHGVGPVSPTPVTASTVLDATTVPVTTEAPVTTTSVTDTASSTTATAVDALHAIDFGLGVSGSRPSVFGFGHQLVVDVDVVLATVLPVLGAPDLDTGWRPMPDSLACKGAIEYRSVLWDDLRFVFEGHDTNSDAVADLVVLTGWSIGNVALYYSPPLEGTINSASGLTTADGLGLGSSKSSILELPWAQVGDYGDQVVGSAGSQVLFVVTDDRIAAISVEDNDC